VVRPPARRVFPQVGGGVCLLSGTSPQKPQIGIQIRTARAAVGWSAEKLAKQAGVGYRGRRCPAKSVVDPTQRSGHVGGRRHRIHRLTHRSARHSICCATRHFRQTQARPTPVIYRRRPSISLTLGTNLFDLACRPGAAPRRQSRVTLRPPRGCPVGPSLADLPPFAISPDADAVPAPNN
jgi:hypothetical protein